MELNCDRFVGRAAREAHICNLKTGNLFRVCLKADKPKKTCVEMAGLRIFRIYTDFWPGFRKAKVYGKFPDVSPE
jgi:hypothetical protein